MRFRCRVIDKLEEGNEVADVLALEEFHAACNEIGDTAFGEFDLDFERLKVGAVEDGDVGEGAAFVHEAADAFDDKLGLFAGVHGLDEKGFLGVGAVGAEFFFKVASAGLCFEDAVGEGEDLGVER